MKAIEWHRYLEEQRRLHGKVVFTVGELANVAQTAAHSLNVGLGRLVRAGIICRMAHGRYGLAGAVTAESLLPALDPGGYITGAYGLYLHQLITQVPVEITCFTNRRHNRARMRQTALGRFVFVCVNRRLYAPPGGTRAVAAPEQALCDFVYLALRRGVAPESQFTFRAWDRLDSERLECTLQRYPKSVARTLKRLMPPGPGRDCRQAM